MGEELVGKVAIVTGGSRGYGAGIAGALAAEGVEVYITGRNEQALAEAAERLNVKPVQADVASGEDWDRVMAAVSEARGGVDILVNNAGAGVKIDALEEQSDREIIRSIEVNLTGAILGCRRVVPVMKRRGGGVIVNISSVCARQAWPGWSVYSAAKAGLTQFSRALYVELREFGVRVTTIMPSWGNTGFLPAAAQPDRDGESARRVIQPHELGDLVAYICRMPAHLEIQDLTLWPTIQEVVPL